MLEVPDDAFDVARFEALLAKGRAALDHDDAVSAASVLRDAIALWHGEPYAEFADEDWVRAESQRLHELLLVAHERLVDAELACGRAAEMVSELERLVAEHPLRDGFRERLMLALYRAGRQADALRAYQDHRAVLAEELGLEPAPALVDLERRILEHDPTPASSPNRPGVRLRGYRIGERLGTGREGTVYAARLPGVERELAIRVYREDVADRPDFVRNFEADAQRVASIRHDAIVPIHDYWREPGAAYLVMRRMTGGTLRDRLQHGPFARDDVTRARHAHRRCARSRRGRRRAPRPACSLVRAVRRPRSGVPVRLHHGRARGGSGSRRTRLRHVRRGLPDRGAGQSEPHPATFRPRCATSWPPTVHRSATSSPRSLPP